MHSATPTACTRSRLEGGEGAKAAVSNERPVPKPLARTSHTRPAEAAFAHFVLRAVTVGP
eukprot:2510577-Alexandrium_andersonii.AAC.1